MLCNLVLYFGLLLALRRHQFLDDVLGIKTGYQT